jgi:hypothetical protein
MPKPQHKFEMMLKDGWVTIEMNRRTAWDIQQQIAQTVTDVAKSQYAMKTVHRLSRMFLELDKSDNLEMLSREDVDTLRSCIPPDFEHKFRWFFLNNWIKPDNDKFKEANLICKSMFDTHEE